jgi:Predicted nucleotide-binding protein containing TIR-like domain
MNRTVFYSWQADTNTKAGRYLIRDALKEAFKELSETLVLDEATRAEPGNPDIFETIQEKINRASFFVPDLTLVGHYTEKTEKKFTPNPNVLVEYGYALRRLGQGRIIPVFNKHFGKLENLPFDINKRVIRVQFDLSPEAKDPYKKEVKKKLAEDLRRELRLAIDKSLWFGISENSRLAVKLFVVKSEYGASQDPKFTIPEFCSHLGLSDSEARVVVDELEGKGLIIRNAVYGGVEPCNELFWKFDRIFKGWDVEQDAEFIAQQLVAAPHSGENQFVIARFAEGLDWSPRRLNPALTFLVDKNHVRCSGVVARHPYAVSSIIETANTRKFVGEKQQ